MYIPKLLSTEEQNKLRRMTVLVGLIGSDGIVFASDTNYYGPAETEVQFDDQFQGPKITTLAQKRLAYACVGDWFSEDIAQAVASAIADEWSDISELRASMVKFAKQRFDGDPRPAPPRICLERS